MITFKELLDNDEFGYYCMIQYSKLASNGFNFTQNGRVDLAKEYVDKFRTAFNSFGKIGTLEKETEFENDEKEFLLKQYELYLKREDGNWEF